MIDTLTAFLWFVSKSLLTIALFSFTLCGKIRKLLWSTTLFCWKKWTCYYWL